MISLFDNVSIIEIDIKNDWVGKNLIELNLRKKYDVNVVAIRENGKVTIGVDPEKPLTKGMSLTLIANMAKLSRLI